MLVACRMGGYPRRLHRHCRAAEWPRNQRGAAASTLQRTDGRFLGPAPVGVSGKVGVAKPRNDTLARASAASLQRELHVLAWARLARYRRSVVMPARSFG